MKVKIISILAVVLMFITLNTNNSYAAKSIYGHAITANPIGLAFGRLDLTYEQLLSSTNSFTVNGMYWSIGDWSAFGIGGSYRWYLDLFKTREKPLAGFSVGPRASLGSWVWNGFADSYDNGVSVSIGGEAAYKWIWDGFAVEIGLNLDFPLIKTEANMSALGLIGSIGYAW